MRIPGSNAHLTYCLNVHPGGTLAEAEAAIFEHAPRVFAEFARLTGARGPYGLGIWFSHAAAEELGGLREARGLRGRLAQAGLYALTFNGFPYGRFHGTRVKEKVYQPDWADPKRTQYTGALIRIASVAVCRGDRVSISTLPVTFRPWADEPRLEEATCNLVSAAGLAHYFRELMGVEITLALEPEPGCYLERTDDAVAYLTEHVFRLGRGMLAEEAGLSEAQAEASLRRHVGVCLDTVHTGVMGEDPKEAVRKYTAAGIRVAKVQLGAALRVQVGPEGPPEALRAFQDEVYLHQTVVATPGGRELYLNDLPEPLGMAHPPEGEWRVHFHVPLAWPGDGPIRTTADSVDTAFLAAALAAGCEHFETEIYTLDVFPAAHASREAILARDMAWLWEKLPR